ncbi:MAG: class I SAM-dependent methyltransferase [Proteobacteria bacterium]|nr:class I SAM-dependent methyltransferase [Pseudomonadota bacterium]
MFDPRAHWQKVYQTKRPETVSWYRPHLDVSVDLIRSAASDLDARIIDVGAGESTLVDDLLQAGYRNLCALDISSHAFDVSRARLGTDAKRISWLVGDVRNIDLTQHPVDLWHDRAVFHFLTRPEERKAYIRQVERSVSPGGHVVVATFGPEGPAQCSGLDIVRYDAQALHNELGPSFQLLEQRVEMHRTPNGSTQQFTYCLCRKL